MPVMVRLPRPWPLAVVVAVVVVVVVVVAGLTVQRPRCPDHPHPALRFATFNIEEFPKNANQIDGAFMLMASLDAGFVAVQEITNPAVFSDQAHQRLGPDWEFLHVDTMPPEQSRLPPMHVGVLFDARSYALRSSTLHDETRLDGRNKPTLEVRLAPRSGGPIVRIFVVHLKAGSDGRPLRARQYQALASILDGAAGSGERIVVLGDFNATEEADRIDLALLASRTGLTWATENLGCTAFWDRDDGCPTSRLDHVLTSDLPSDVAAHGACAEGCQLRDRCPLYAEQVSDHCPVTVTVP